MVRPPPEPQHFPPDLAGVLAIMIVPIVACLSVGSFIFHLGPPGIVYLASASAAVGIGLLFAARLPLYRQHRFFSFGWRDLDSQHRRLYWRGYAFVVVSIILFAFVLALPHVGRTI